MDEDYEKERQEKHEKVKKSLQPDTKWLVGKKPKAMSFYRHEG